MSDQSRRDFLSALGGAVLASPLVGARRADSSRTGEDERRSAFSSVAAPRGVIVRTITAGVALERLSDSRPMGRALARLARAKRRFEREGYEVQTTRVTLPPLVAAMNTVQRRAAFDEVRALDARCAAAGVMLGLGPVLTVDRPDDELAAWAAELVLATKVTSFSAVIASPERGIHSRGVRVAAAMMRSVADARPNGMGSFQFAAAANVPAGTPFFPVGWHAGPDSLAVGLQSPGIVRAAFTGASDREDARRRLAARLASELREVERIATDVARREAVRYGGIDSSPAPLGDDSIAGAIEALTGAPFGEAGTLQACAMITDEIKRVPVKLCGYSGLMLPVLEDRVLARRAREGHFGMRDLLLFSSVCGTGLDVIPLPGDTPQATIERILLDVAAQATKLGKALSARLFLVPGKKVGDVVRFDDPRLFETTVMRA
jgi:uncharacterized protein (UPF0210 family)